MYQAENKYYFEKYSQADDVRRKKFQLKLICFSFTVSIALRLVMGKWAVKNSLNI